MSGNSFSIEERISKTEIWYEWLSFRIRHYFILEIVFLVLFALLLTNSYHISSQNVKTLKLISNLHDRMENLEKLKDLNRESKFEKLQNVIPQKMEKQESSNCSVPIINAANYLIGASVNNNKPDNSDELVLLDRPDPPEAAAWCSDEEKPTLTINLAEYIKPLYVSYQHARRHGMIPNGAPEIYDVVACFDNDCNEGEPLVSNCNYAYVQEPNQKPEQFCHIPPNPSLPPIGTVQFRFRKNHGNVEKTCVNLIRVYGETRKRPVDAKKRKENSEKCSTLAWEFRSFPPSYLMREKNCSMLYKMECCDECPQCCSQCEIDDRSEKGLFVIFLICCFIIPIIFVCCKSK